MHANFKPRKGHSDRSDFSFTAKKYSLPKSNSVFSTPDTDPEQPGVADLLGREAQKAEEVERLEAALQRNREELSFLRKAIQERRVEEELRSEILVLEENNRQLERTRKESSELALMYKNAASSATNLLDLVKEENLELSQHNSKMRFLVSYLVERLEALFERFEGDALKLEGRVGQERLQEALGGYWLELRRTMAREQYNLCGHARKTVEELGREGGGERVLSKLLVRELL